MNKLNSIGFGLLLITLLLAAGCSKDKYASKPSLKFKSASSYDVVHGGLLTLRLEYTDAEGDLGARDTSIIIRRSVARCSNGTLTIANYQLPDVPATKNASGEIVIRFENGTQNYQSSGYAGYNPSPCITSRPDTTTFLFYIKDKAGNISDSVTTDRPIIIRP